MSVSLVLGDLNLIDKDGSPFAVELLAEGTEWGNPLPEEVAIQSLLQDGDLVEHTRDGNREQALRIVIKASDSAALAEGEAALMAELYKRNTLTYTPADGWGPPTVFDVVTSSLQQIPDDLAEVRAGERHYSVRVISLPFGRSVDEVTFTPTPTSVGTDRQRLHSVTVAGSARTDARITLQHASASLGEATIYTYDDDGVGYTPAMRPSLSSSGATTADAALVSGARNMLDTDVVYTPSYESMPAGRYLLRARLRGSSAGTVSLSVTTGAKFGATVKSASSANVALTVATAWADFNLGLVKLPSFDVGDPEGAAAAADVYISIVDNDSTGIDVDIDELWAYNLDIGSLTQVTCGTFAPAAGSHSNRLFLFPPTTATPRPRLLTGTAADMSDAYYGGFDVLAWGAHSLNPGVNKVFTVTTNTTAAVLAGGYWPRWHTHAGL